MMRKIICIVLSIFLVLAVVCTCFFDFTNTVSTVFCMGTYCTFSLYGADENASSLAENKCIEIDKICSLTIPESEANKLNKNGQTENACLARQAEICLDVFSSSHGAFDISIRPVSKLWDIGHENRIPEKDELASALSLVDANKVTVSGDKISLADGQELDFGGVTKGFAAEKIVELLKDKCSGGVISIGGSVGVFGKSDVFGKKFAIAVRDPFDTNEFFGIVHLSEGYVSTSGDYERYFESDGKRYHHIFDPATGYPAETPLASATVISSSGTLSDALSTACFVLGFDSEELLAKYSASAVLISKDGEYKVIGDVDFEKT